MDPETTPTTEVPLDTPASEVSSGGATVEEVEEFWRRRMAGKERAWNAEASVLRDQNESLRRPQATPGNGAEPDQMVTELRRQLEAEQAARTVDQRKLKYPALAAQNPGDAAFAAIDEAGLAKLNVLAEDGVNGTYIAPTSPRKPTPTVAKRPEDMDDGELKQALRSAAEAMDQARQI